MIRRTSIITYIKYLYNNAKGRDISITPESKRTINFILILKEWAVKKSFTSIKPILTS
jgi:hypothetical protein